MFSLTDISDKKYKKKKRSHHFMKKNIYIFVIYLSFLITMTKEFIIIA